jgi:rubrerythrin
VYGIVLHEQEVIMEEQEVNEPKPTATKWVCPECKQKLTLFVAPSVAPTCNNPQAHPKKIVKMESKSK